MLTGNLTVWSTEIWVYDTTMSALHRKLKARKGEEPKPDAAPPPPANRGGAAARAPLLPNASDTGMRRGFMSAADLYPHGSSEAGRAVTNLSWREKMASGKPVFELRSVPDGYEVYGAFREAGRFLGKEDFVITRTGFHLRIAGNVARDEQCLVAGLDEAVPLPVDVEWETVSAEYKDCELVVSAVFRLIPLCHSPFATLCIECGTPAPKPITSPVLVGTADSIQAFRAACTDARYTH